MTTYELVNPSDKVLLQSEEFEPACLAAIHAGHGWYGLEGEGGELVLPILATGGADEWFTERFGVTLEGSLDRIPMDQVCTVLESFRYPEGYEPTSLNDIVQNAHELAALYRKRIAGGIA